MAISQRTNTPVPNCYPLYNGNTVRLTLLSIPVLTNVQFNPTSFTASVIFFLLLLRDVVLIVIGTVSDPSCPHLGEMQYPRNQGFSSWLDKWAGTCAC